VVYVCIQWGELKGMNKEGRKQRTGFDATQRASRAFTLHDKQAIQKGREEMLMEGTPPL